MSGYSQGGQLVHNAAEQLGSQASGVDAVVIFGDPGESGCSDREKPPADVEPR